MVKKTRKIKRKCLVCGKNISAIVDKKGKYNNGHYFGKFKLPIGKGEYKKVDTMKMGRNKYDVVKWTGKEKQLEYWECNKCFEKTDHECWLEEKIEKLFGERCKDFEPSCHVCNAWDIYDTIRKN